MTRKIVLLTICKNIVWKETSKYLKHFRMKNMDNLDTYNIYAWELIALYRKTENEIDNDNIRYTKFEYRDKIIELEAKIIKKLSIGK